MWYCYVMKIRIVFVDTWVSGGSFRQRKCSLDCCILIKSCMFHSFITSFHIPTFPSISINLGTFQYMYTVSGCWSCLVSSRSIVSTTDYTKTCLLLCLCHAHHNLPWLVGPYSSSRSCWYSNLIVHVVMLLMTLLVKLNDVSK